MVHYPRTATGKIDLRARAQNLRFALSEFEELVDEAYEIYQNFPSLLSQYDSQAVFSIDIGKFVVQSGNGMYSVPLRL